MADLSKESIAEVVKLGRMSVTVQTAKEGGIPFAVVPDGCKVQDLASLLYNSHNERPERKKGTARVFDAPSFCEYFTLFRDAHSRVFANETTGQILAVIDYHEAAIGGPRWGEHRLEFTLRKSEEWTRWVNNNSKKQLQMDFAEFMEDNAPDIVSPDAATMLEVARDLSAKTDVDFGSAIRMANGSVQFKFSEQVRGTFGSGNVEVPERFTIAIPIYIGTANVELVARLRYRINSGKLTFWYDLLRADVAEREGFLSIRQEIAERLNVTVLNGVPA